MSGAAAYSLTASWFHWAVALPLVGCVGTVLKAQDAPKEEKGKWMFRHKSLGLLTAGVVAPRVAYRIMSSSTAYNVAKLEGASGLENILSKIVHYSLYGFMLVMPATGIAMGYYGGKGLPFFYTTIPGIVKTDQNKASTGAIAKQSFQIHKQVGVYGKYLVPVHVGAAFVHFARGHRIFFRVNPFRGPSPH
uniref:Cytochrome b561 bacterial/Ni-hydrogenase domain-containing protein n=1 Tax=Cyclophora tenuis TaxID=216820 RepID=A0A7S1D541_CYCTE|mmetsp:Transcript_23517/g.39891  ORF Transcript_23517/g.39891 Transcript_23517/m.39891 type:complete len:191 (+) Transcript_23517:64-636(+)|eukprot:CAMPEP_0116573672 /NCGR_PEP_ID=MMETSP0397-20121206/18927_1 /TAXON_ID=216820 /ORGANISM="Cyclophora tenuis, Strain ECT3854" /LENGTH=190 /DNA_ID=CAMNT_0004102269 /DNA_START=169 /DNA_END=741 /DNA_ORIENTATION=-